jgi:hypothetical protein
LLALICILFSKKSSEILIAVPQIKTNNSIMVPVLKKFQFQKSDPNLRENAEGNYLKGFFFGMLIGTVWELDGNSMGTHW